MYAFPMWLMWVKKKKWTLHVGGSGLALSAYSLSPVGPHLFLAALKKKERKKKIIINRAAELSWELLTITANKKQKMYVSNFALQY